MTVECPLECEHLIKSRQHEPPPSLRADDLPERDVQINDAFMEDNADLVMYVSSALLAGARSKPGTVDADIMEALQALVKTYRTLESGLIYETRAPNPYALAVQDHAKAAIEEFQRLAAEEAGMASVRDADVLGVLVFLERAAWHHGNGRPRGKAFLSFLYSQFPPAAKERLVLS